MKARKKWLLIFIVIILGTGSFYGYSWWKSQGRETTGNMPVTQSFTVTRTTIEQRVTASGPVVPENDAQLYFGRAGRIKKMHVTEGQRLAEGTLIAELEADEEELDLLTARRQYETARIEAGPSIVKEREMALEIIEERLERTKLVAPFAGVVVEVTAGRGEWMATTNYLLTLVDDSKLYINATIDEVDISRVKLGQEAVVTFTALPGKRVRGRVVDVAKLPRTQSDLVLFPVKIELIEPGPDVLIGLSAEVSIVTNRREDILAVPVEAVLDYQGKQIVTVIGSDGVSTEVEVSAGLSDGRMVEITRGLAEGDVILASNFELYRRLNGPAQHGPNMRVNLPGMRR